MSIVIRLLQDDEISVANNFFNSIYGTSRSLENFKWEFINGPNGKAIYIIAIDTSVTTDIRIVGIQCAIPLEFIESNGIIILTAKSEDTLVDPAYRGQKIFERMYDALFEACQKAGVKYIWGFTPALKAFERIGFSAPFKTQQALLVFNPWGAYQHLSALNRANKSLDRFKIFGLCVLSWVNQKFNLMINGNDILEPSDSMGKNLFTQLYNGKPYVHLNQTEKYLKWRHKQNPYGNDYSNYVVKKNNQIAAHITVNIRKDIGYIEEVLLSSNLTKMEKQQTLKAVIVKLKKRKVSLIRVLCFDSNEELILQSNLLKATGFISLKRGNFFVWKSLDTHERLKPEQLLLNRFYLQGNM